MRHRKDRLKKIDLGIQKNENVIRNMLTSLIRNGQVKTTKKRANVLVSRADSFFAGLVSKFDKYNDENVVRREAIREVKSVIFTDNEGKKVVNELLPKYKEEGKRTGFTNHYKLGFRKGDGAEKVIVELK